MENKYKAGNTVRLYAEFKDYADQLSDPPLIRFKLYNQRYEVVHDISLSSSNKESQGKYFYDYTIPMEFVNQKFYYEFNGEVGGVLSLNRDKFSVVFI